MEIEVGKKYLITTTEWFIAPDGQSRKSVHGTVTNVSDAKETLGISTNRNSTNWYVTIGSMIVAGCQVHYAIQVDTVDFDAMHIAEHNGEEYEVSSRIFNADA